MLSPCNELSFVIIVVFRLSTFAVNLIREHVLNVVVDADDERSDKASRIRNF